MPYRVKMRIGVGLVLCSIVAIIAAIVSGAYGAPIWMLILIPSIAVLLFALGIAFVPKTNEDGTPFVKEKNPNNKKPNKCKVKKSKKPFMTEEEWGEQEEEDDEMMFVEEVVEDD